MDAEIIRTLMTNESNHKERDGARLLAAAMKDCVERSGYSPAQIADKMGVAKTTVYDMIENRMNPTLERIEELFEACGDSFGRWLEGRWKYGKDKSLHERLQKVLDSRDRLAQAARTNVEALWTLYIQEQKRRRRQGGQDKS